MTKKAQDSLLMQRALELALKGRFTTAPNPNVGCVIEKDGQILAEAYHQRAGEGHAEARALASLPEGAAKGSTCYVTLEPCSHFGRTPPCADALIQAGVSRVVMAMLDPNPEVAGKGMKKLHQAGVDVEVGLLQDSAAKLNRGFFKRMEIGKPWVKAKVASSLDGCTAMQSGESKWITSEASRDDVQLERASSQAIVTGINTVLTDDPLLNVRPNPVSTTPEGIGERQPLRVVLDTKGRLPFTSSLVQSAQADAPILWAVDEALSDSGAFIERINAMPSSVELLYLPKTEAGLSLDSLLCFLGQQKQINTLMVEAGAGLVGSFLQEQHLDEWVHYQAPIVLGASARPLANSFYDTLNECPRFELESQITLGPDIKSHYRVIYTPQTSGG